jgi:putative copper resistance protein D
MILAGIALARGLYFIATMLLFGSAMFGVLLKSRLPVIPPPDLPRRWTLPLALTAGSVWFLLAAAQMAGEMSQSAILQTATATLFGQVFLARALALLGLVFVLRHDKAVALLAATALVLPAVTSHAAASSPAGFAAIGMALDAAHLLTAGFWIGGLAVLAVLFARKERNIALALTLFSDWALPAVLLLVMTGLINAASIILGGGAPGAPYLGVLSAKLALVLIMLALAVANRFKLEAQDKAIARNAGLELGLGVIVVLLAGALGQLPPTL